FCKQKTAYEIFHVTGVQTCALPICSRALLERPGEADRAVILNEACLHQHCRNDMLTVAPDGLRYVQVGVERPLGEVRSALHATHGFGEAATVIACPREQITTVREQCKRIDPRSLAHALELLERRTAGRGARCRL